MTHTAAAGPNWFVFCPLLIALYGLIWQHLKSYIFDKKQFIKKKKKIPGKIAILIYIYINGKSREAREASENSREIKSAKIREK